MPELYKFLLLNGFNRTSLNISSSDFFLRDANEFYQGSDLAFMMVASAMVLLMIPGIGLFYSGSSEKSSSISMLWLSLMTVSVIGIQWWVCGYSIAFSGSNKVWGGSEAMFFRSSLFLPWGGDVAGTKIPQIAFALFQGMFACFTGAIISGAVIRTEEPLHFLVFIFLWTTFIYDPIARSTWHPAGIGNYWDGKGSGVFDFAGGTVVHISSATTSVVYSMWCKWKRQIFCKQTRLTTEQIKDDVIQYSEPHNIINVMLGTALLYFGWFGFNGGSALGANLRAVSACLSTHLAACAGAATGTGLEYWAASWRGEPARFSVIGFCNGVLTGLVAITPAAGYVPSWSAPIFGLLGSALCFSVQDFSKYWFDIHHIFIMHGYAGFIGMMLTAAFARAEIIQSDGHSTFVSRKEQAGLQLADVTVNIIFTATGSLFILIVMEGIILLTRRFRGRPVDPGFKAVHDVDIIVTREQGRDRRSLLKATEEDVELANLSVGAVGGSGGSGVGVGSGSGVGVGGGGGGPAVSVVGGGSDIYGSG